MMFFVNHFEWISKICFFFFLEGFEYAAFLSSERPTSSAAAEVPLSGA